MTGFRRPTGRRRGRRNVNLSIALRKIGLSDWQGAARVAPHADSVHDFLEQKVLFETGERGLAWLHGRYAPIGMAAVVELDYLEPALVDVESSSLRTAVWCVSHLPDTLPRPTASALRTPSTAAASCCMRRCSRNHHRRHDRGDSWRRRLGREVHRAEPALRRRPHEGKRHAESV